MKSKILSEILSEVTPEIESKVEQKANNIMGNLKIKKADLHFNLFTYKAKKELKNVSGWIHLEDNRSLYYRAGAITNTFVNDADRKRIKLYIIRKLKIYRIQNYNFMDRVNQARYDRK